MIADPIQALREEGRLARQEEQSAQAEREEDKRKAKALNELMWFEALRQVLGFDPETWRKFDAEFLHDGYHPQVRLNWLSCSYTIAVCTNIPTLDARIEWLRGAGQALQPAKLRTEIGKFVLDAEEKYNALKQAALESLRDTRGYDAWHYNYSRYAGSIVWGDPDVLAARIHYLLKRLPRWENDPAIVESWLKSDRSGLRDAALDQAVEAVTKMLERRRVYLGLLHAVEHRVDPETGVPLGEDGHYDRWDNWVSATPTEEEITRYVAVSHAAGFGDDPKIRAAIQTHLDAKDRAEREAEALRLRDEAERAAFSPFAFYRVSYGVVARDEEGGAYADTEMFDTLSDRPGADGYWTTLSGGVVKPAHLVLIERVEVATLEALKQQPWTKHHTAQTEHGMIRVPPAGAG